MNILVRDPFWIMVFSGYMSSSGIAGSYGTTYVTQNYTITKEKTTAAYNMDESHRENSKEKS